MRRTIAGSVAIPRIPLTMNRIPMHKVTEGVVRRQLGAAWTVILRCIGDLFIAAQNASRYSRNMALS